MPGLIKVVYIAGSGRTGSTILGQMLGTSPHFFFAGELIDFWRRGLAESRLCACGLPAAECEFWGRVLQDLEASLGPDEIQSMVRLRSKFHNLARETLMFSPGRERLLRRYIRPHMHNLTHLYRSIQRRASGTVIVDSSKFPSYAMALKAIPDIELYVVHLVRDPRAVAFSWRRVKRIPDPKENLFLPRFGPVESSVRWILRNVLTEKLRPLLKERLLRIRYEDLMKRPVEELSRVAELVSAPAPELLAGATRPQIDGTNHAVWGNSDRFRSGQIELQLDDEWVQGSTRAQLRLVSHLTRPWSGRYGYPYGETA